MRNARIEATACQTTSHDYQNDPRMKVVREFLWREVLKDTRNGHSGDEIYWLLAEGLLRSLDAAAWQPIETAPKDGSCIIVDVPVIGADVVSWWGEGWRETTNGLRLRDSPKFWMSIPPFPKVKP